MSSAPSNSMPHRRVLLRSGEPVKLFPKEFDTLLALLERNGEVLEKDDLMRHVWQDQIVEESNLTTNISHLRKLLGEKRGSHDYIVTVPGRGYRFVAGVRQAFDEVVVRERTRVTIEEEEIDPAETSAPGERKNGHQTQSSDTCVVFRETTETRNGSLSPRLLRRHCRYQRRQRRAAFFLSPR